MWLLSCEGDVLGGKRSWLRPGSVHLLGRTSGRGDGEQIHFIDQKSVSRKHLLIKVAEVTDADAANLYTRPKLTVTDGSKTGTHLNDEKIKQKEKELTGNEYTIRLGIYEAAFKIEWKPVVLSNNVKKSPDRELLAGTGIKVVKEFVAGSTTHVVGKKRNSPSVLSALVCGRWVVTDGFVKALAEATRKIESEDIAVSPLEQDFDAHWPKEDEYPIPVSTEPVHRENGYLKPNPNRAEVFQDFVFIFLTQAQYDSLMPVVTSGGGKALLHEVEQASDADGLLAFTRDAAGYKKSGNRFRLTQQTGQGGVVLVQHASQDDWAEDFTSLVDKALGQRSIMQNEFLDAILTLDVTTLRQPLPVDEEQELLPPTDHQSQPPSAPPGAMDVDLPPSSPPPSQQHPPSAQPKAEPESSAPAYKRRRRIATQNLFKGFDEIDPSDLIVPSGREESPEILQAMDVDAAGTQNHTGMKRPASSPVEEEEPLAGQAEFKRRRLEDEARAKKSSNATSREDTPANGFQARARKGKQKEIDVKAELQKQRREEEERHRKDEEQLRAHDEDVDIRQLRDLAIIEQMELPARQQTSRSFTQTTQSDRWKPEWEGRKNFKRFRRHGQEVSQEPRSRSRLIVTVHEVGVPRHAVEMSMPKPSSSRWKARKSQSQAHTQTQTQTLIGDDEEGAEDDATRFRRRVQRSLEEDAEAAELEDEFADEFDDDAVAAGPSIPKAAARKKRAAAPAKQNEGPPAKKARATTSRAAPVVYNVDDDDDDDSDDDQLKFRRKKR